MKNAKIAADLLEFYASVGYKSNECENDDDGCDETGMASFWVIIN